jgi:hypothetical protein
MSTWAAIAAREAAIAASAGTTALHGIAPSALDGFAAGALLTGVCFLIVIAPRAFRRDRLSARQGMWLGGLRRSRADTDYYATPAEAYSPAVTYPHGSPAETHPYGGGVSELAVATTAGLVAEEVLLAQADRGHEAFSPAASQDFGGHAGADPYADPFGASSDDDIVLPGDDVARDEGSGRGYRSKHRMTGQDGQDRRPEPRRGPPRHAAPSSRSRFGTRMSSRIAMFPLAPARG